ncbi:MAG: alcohol dehydrogenase [Cytophagaceae bacterium]|nr:alcohol dehydrogenase [Cytophagaceae bacterium]|tara:strand:- start:3550 stop:4506 length:957 start_codon:yes stop_codon:yes gene_type:complete
MKMRKLGNTDLETAPIVFGGNVFGWTLDKKESFELLDAFVEAGFNTIDTADVYSRWKQGNTGGESETIIGKWLQERNIRDKVNIITKVGSDMGQGKKDISEEYILKAVDASLKRLQLEQIDLYLTHWDDDRTPVEETLGAYEKLIKAGKVRNIGASNLSPARLKESLEASAKNGLPRYEVFQPEYNLYDRKGFEQDIHDICIDEGLGVVTYFSLASGFLTGKYQKKEDAKGRNREDFVKKYFDDKGMAILNALEQVSKKHEVSQAAVSLAWLMNSKGVTAPIASATKKKQLTAFIEAANLQLTPEDMEILDNPVKMSV